MITIYLFVVITVPIFSHLWLIIGCLSRVKRRVVISGAGIACPSGTPNFNPGFALCGSCCSTSSLLYSINISLFVFLSSFFWSLYCIYIFWLNCWYLRKFFYCYHDYAFNRIMNRKLEQSLWIISQFRQNETLPLTSLIHLN